MNKQKRNNEQIMKIIEKKFDSYPYEGSEEFEKLKKKTKELGDIALFEEAVERLKKIRSTHGTYCGGWHDMDNVELDLCGECQAIKEFIDKKVEPFLTKQLNLIATKSAEESYKKALDDMFLEICKLAEPDERQPSAGDLNTHMDNIHDIRVKLSKPKE